MFKYIGLAFLSVAAILMIPASSQAESVSSPFYGLLQVTVYDADGNEVLRQQIHNQLMDDGEEFIIAQTFTDGSTVLATDNDLIGSICISDDGTFTDPGAAINESTLNQVAFDAANTLDTASAGNCIDESPVGGTVRAPQIGPLTFTYSTHTPASGAHTVTNIGVCNGEGTAGSQAFNTCLAGGPTLFSVIDITDFTLSVAGEQANIDYTFNLETPTS